MRGFEYIGSKGNFLAKNHIMSPQAMYFWPKNGQNSQNKNFPRHNTAIRWFKTIVPSFWPSFTQIWCVDSKKMSKNLIFWLKMAKNGKNWPFLAKNGQTRIFFKNPLGTFFQTHQDVAFCKKSSKSDARFSRYAVTDARTDGRTHKCESIGLNG